jgi:hypothetical protein
MSTKTDALMQTFHPKYYPFVNIKRARVAKVINTYGIIINYHTLAYIVLQMPDQINRFSILYV